MNNISQIFVELFRNLIPIIIIIFLFMHNCYSLNRTKRTIGIFRRPDKLEAITSYLTPEPGFRAKTRFYLYTRHNSQHSQELTIGNEELLLKSWFNPSLPIKFVINGWLDNRYFAKWVRSGISALLVHGNYNVIYVGWKSIKELFVAAIMIKIFSQDLTQFIVFLKNIYGINGESIHCIGHSLGSFLCGFAGAITYIGRLTVLDAGPRPWYESMPEWDRINRWQAGFVDVIHSDYNPLLSWGLTIPVGDVDFFPNTAPQPGCMRDKLVQGFRELRDEGLVVGIYQWVRYMLFCSHYRSHEWFFESVSNKKCSFIGVRCPSYQMFLNGQCACDTSQNSCAMMGMDADNDLNRQIIRDSIPGKWFIKTSDFVKQTGTHCLFQYQLYLSLGQLFPISNGSIVLTIHSENGITQELLKPYNHELYPGLRFGKLVVRQHPMIIKKVSISWSLKDSDISCSALNWISLKHLKISPILLSSDPKSLIQYYCSSQPLIKPKQTLNLINC